MEISINNWFLSDLQFFNLLQSGSQLALREFLKQHFLYPLQLGLKKSIMHKKVDSGHNYHNKGSDKRPIIGYKAEADRSRWANLINKRVKRPQIKDQRDWEAINIGIEGPRLVSYKLFERVY